MFDFYSLGTNATDPRRVCKDCWKAVNAEAHLKRQAVRNRRKALLGLSKNSQRMT